MINYATIIQILHDNKILLPNGTYDKKSVNKIGKIQGLEEQIVEVTSFFEDTTVTLMGRVIAIVNNITKQPKCVVCNKLLQFRPSKRGFSKYCPNSKGKSCAIKDKTLNEQRQQTCLKRHGNIIPQRTDHIKQKTLATNIQKYGVESPTQLQEFKEKSKQTCISRFGVENVMKNVLIQKKAEQTNLEKYGAKTYAESCVPVETIQLLQNKIWCEENIKDFTLHEMSINLKCSTFIIRRYFKQHNIDIRRFRPATSSAQRELVRLFSEHQLSFIENDRSILKTHDVDVYIPSLNLAIEYDGLYYHTEHTYKKTKNYHIEKTNRCNEKNIRLIHIWSNEWKNNKEAVKSKVLHACGHSKAKIFARKCSIGFVTESQTKTFINVNTFMTLDVSDINYGLFYEEELVCVIGFSKKQDESKLCYFVPKLYTHIPGAFSKLTSYFIKTHKPQIIKNCVDKRWGSNGECFASCGFTHETSVSPTHHYVYLNSDTNVLLSRHNFQKSKLSKKLKIFNPTLSVWENMKNNNYDRIWDCGHDVWTWVQHSQ